MRASTHVQDIAQLWDHFELVLRLFVAEAELASRVRACRKDAAIIIDGKSVALAGRNLDDALTGKLLNLDRCCDSVVAPANA